MAEERHEDEVQAKAERLKKRQYAPNEVLFDAKRLRPLILAFGRDCFAFEKNRIIYEIRKSMPGIFLHLDFPEKMGLTKPCSDARCARCSEVYTDDSGSRAHSHHQKQLIKDV